MNHLFIPYNLAVLAKEKGFNQPCISGWRPGPDLRIFESLQGYQNSDFNRTISAPLYQQMVDWFRKKGVAIEQTTNRSNYNWKVRDTLNDVTIYSENSEDYYFGFNKAIETALYLI